MNVSSTSSSIFLGCFLLTLFGGMLGCEQTPAEFTANTEGLVTPQYWFAEQMESLQERREEELAQLEDPAQQQALETQLQERKKEIDEEYRERFLREKEVSTELANVLKGYFGTPNKPYVSKELGLDYKQIALASGPTNSANDLVLTKSGQVYAGMPLQETESTLVLEDLNAGPLTLEKSKIADRFPQRGLYRQHCMHCHGMTGDGNGPTASFLHPYPRDFRPGKFKFISTHRASEKPTKDDLIRILKNGIHGTAMPAFLLLPDDQLGALAEYVIYLSMRGEIELYLRQLSEIEEDFAVPGEEDFTKELVDSGIDYVSGNWQDLDSKRVQPPAPPEMPLEESIALGRELFYDEKRTKCAGCHGDYALGDGQIQVDYWNKLKANTQGEPVEDVDKLFALPLQKINPRNLRIGTYRGGRRPIDLYWRMYCGVIPSGMPEFGSSLSSDDIWHLVHYVQSLPYDSISKAAVDHNPQAPARERF
ncbi:Hypothetical protein PBC10988_13440 [Planctomycetales bacterium 10988]|nr:Hypothetical protein PBC10988_13440 [Planctomycetales bacterium 10988]